MSHNSCLGDKRSLFIYRIILSTRRLLISPAPGRSATRVSPRHHFGCSRQYHRPWLPSYSGAAIRQRARSISYRDCKHSHFKNTHRSEHSQSVRTGETDEASDESDRDEAQEEVSDDAQANDLHPAENESVVMSHPAHALKSQQLFKAIGKHLPFSGPSTVLQQIPLNEDEEECDWENARFSLQLVNEEYNIQCKRVFVAAEQDQISLNAIYGELVSEYVKSIKDRLKPNSVNGVIETFDMPKIRSALRMEPLSASVTPFHINPNADSEYQLFRAQTYSGDEPLGQAQIWPHQGFAERMARNSADADTLKLARQQGLSISAFRSSSSSKSNRILPKKRTYDLELVTNGNSPAVYDVPLSQSCISAMLQVLRDTRACGLPDEVELQTLNTASTSSRRTQHRPRVLRAISKQLKLDLQRLERAYDFRKIRTQQNKLPIRNHRFSTRICKLVKENDVLVLVSETGSGKTTQLPQILLEEAILSGFGATCNITCTQPRRIAATSVAKRVAYERFTRVGGSVGHSVRFDHQRSSQNGSINYTTAGVLLKNLQDDADAIFNQTSHIIVDEVHERDLTVDLLISVLRDSLKKRLPQGKRCPKVILMSATMKSIDFETYFAEAQNACGVRVASVTIPGRAYFVTNKNLDDIVPELSSLYGENQQVMQMLQDSREYLEWEDDFVIDQRSSRLDVTEPHNSTGGDATTSEQNVEPDPFRDAVVPYPLMTATITHILTTSKKGDILVFLPGMKEIDQLALLLDTLSIHDQDLKDSDKIRIFKLHSALHQTNATVFEPIPEGCRRIILATNIAQTSITLPGVVHVIDSGKRREMRYDSVTRKNEFVSTWIDKATSLQRRGRAGRVQDGCYWAMFTKARFDAMPEKANPEILISDLTTMSLTLKSHSNDIDLQEFFSKTLDPPNPAVVAACAQELQEMNMLTADQNITPLGKFCSDFPLHPAKARGLLIGLLFDCFLPLMITASHDVNSPLIHSANDKKQTFYTSLAFAGVADDDRYAFINAFQQYDKAVRSGSVEEIKSLEQKNVQRDVHHDMLFVGEQLYNIMLEYGLFPPYSGNEGQVSPDRDSLFQILGHVHNKNTHQINLFKAIALTVNDTNLAVWNEKEQSWVANDMKCMLSPHGVNTMQSLKLLARTPYRRSGEVVSFASMVRNVLSSTRPFLVETSSITPLMAMLFGGPIALVDENTIEIDGWLRYRLSVTANKDAMTNSTSQNVSPARMVLEVRKAIDRFLILAFADLRKIAHLSEAQRQSNAYNTVFRSNSLRETMATGLIKVLDTDAQHWDEMVHFADTDGLR